MAVSIVMLLMLREPKCLLTREEIEERNEKERAKMAIIGGQSTLKVLAYDLKETWEMTVSKSMRFLLPEILWTALSQSVYSGLLVPLLATSV